MENKESLQLTFVGDIFPADLEFNIGFGIKSLFEHHQGNPWELILKELFNKADIALYEVKKESGNGIRFFNEDS